ncbi:HPHL1-like protein [Mya arenaria]|uniref:HPHL1-like protein n=1 Tax=Mya arenaria TaxID=6604 RepID=A0ABY7DES4_MYAAR|nr:HPHL1-like protein [Mya arenaria]
MTTDVNFHFYFLFCFSLTCIATAFILDQPIPGSDVINKTDGSFNVRNYRDYYLRAEKVLWDYLPLQENVVDSYTEYLEDTLKNKNNRVGSKYLKYVYKLYTDGNFTQEIKSPPSFGYVGPLLRVEVGEVMRIHFRNDVDMPVSVHPHGVKYTKINEGAQYMDGTNGASKSDDGVPQGTDYLYTWELTSDFSPRDDDPSCIPFAYHSHVDPEKEVNSGLVGLLLVCKQVLTERCISYKIVSPMASALDGGRAWWRNPKLLRNFLGTLRADGTRSDVDSEQVLYFDSIDEGATWLTDENLKRCGDPDECKRLYESGDPDFEESLKKDSINGIIMQLNFLNDLRLTEMGLTELQRSGKKQYKLIYKKLTENSRNSVNGYMYANLPNLTVCAGDRVAWYIFSLSAEIHTVNRDRYLASDVSRNGNGGAESGHVARAVYELGTQH